VINSFEKMILWLRNLWKNYKYRFVPWISLNVIREEQKKCLKNIEAGIKNRSDVTENDPTSKKRIGQLQNIEIDYVTKSNILITNKELQCTLVEFFEKLTYQRNSKYTKEDIHNKNCSIFYDHFGFLLGRRKSVVAPEAGLGVFVVEGSAKTGSLVGLYPGTVYMPHEPLFFPSLGNSFIFRCTDGIHIDGNDRWVSKSIYKSCAARDQFNFDFPCCDTSWLTCYPQNLLNMGQYVNNQSRNHNNNVVYQECSLFLTDSKQLRPTCVNEDECFPVKLARFVPNVWSNPVNNMQYSLRIIPLVAVDNVLTGSELLSSYFTVIHDS